jgi:hypothetical protein
VVWEDGGGNPTSYPILLDGFQFDLAYLEASAKFNQGNYAGAYTALKSALAVKTGGSTPQALSSFLFKIRSKLGKYAEVRKETRSLIERGYETVHLHQYVTEEKFAEICSRARITLGINSVNNIRMYASWRYTLDSMASGAFHLIHYVPGMEDLFENRKHLVWFDSVPKAGKLIQYYLTRKRERQEIAEAGWREVLARHTWDDRIACILEHWRRLRPQTCEGQYGHQKSSTRFHQRGRHPSIDRRRDHSGFGQPFEAHFWRRLPLHDHRLFRRSVIFTKVRTSPFGPIPSPEMVASSSHRICSLKKHGYFVNT